MRLAQLIKYCRQHAAGIMLVTTMPFATIVTQAAEWHVAPHGTAANDGTADRPWDLQTALHRAPDSASTPRIRPGDTLWLHAGSYQGGFESTLTGTPAQPIVVRQAPHERAVIDCRPRDERDNGLFAIRGAHAIYWGFEVTCSDPHRVTTIPGSWPEDIRRGGVNVYGSHIKLINLHVHDTGGIGAWADGEGGEIYGCLIYNNGWKGPDRGHGHAIYAQNRLGTKRLADNILFNQFAYGIHCYGSDKASLVGFQIEGNISFNNGSLSGPNESAPGIMVGGGTPVERLQVSQNFVYGGGLRCGYTWGVPSKDAVIQDNYVVGRLAVRDFQRLSLTRNRVISADSVVSLETERDCFEPSRQWDWDRNEYYRVGNQYSDLQFVTGETTTGVDFDAWRKGAGIDQHTTYHEGDPQGVHVFVRPNEYEQGRAHIVIFNWDRADSVAVDLSKVLKQDQHFRIVSAQNFDGAPVLEGVFNPAAGSQVTLPMHPAVAAVKPVGMMDVALPVTEPQFGAFIVLAEESAEAKSRR